MSLFLRKESGEELDYELRDNISLLYHECSKFLPRNLELVQLKNRIIYSKNHIPSLLVFDIFILSPLKPPPNCVCAGFNAL